ncbi:MAG: hypothetical protein WCE90_06885 [Candidatus Zixiibacteriota bacterium]
MKTNLFELGFIHVDDLIFHETCDFSRVCKLADRIKSDGHLKNPVLVAGFPPGGAPAGLACTEKEKLLVLDGTNRVSALKLLGFPHVLAQKVDYTDPRVELTSWNHLLFRISKDKLIEKLEGSNLKIVSLGSEWYPGDGLLVLDDVQAGSTMDGKVVCLLIFRDHSGLVVNQKDQSPESRIKGLSSVIALYNASWEVFHPGSGDGLLTAFDAMESCSAINVLPRFAKEEVIDLASRGVLFPSGVTRFVIPQWVLGLEISCSVLADKAPLSEKNLFLKELLSYRMKTKKAKFYQESVFLFNE